MASSAFGALAERRLRIRLATGLLAKRDDHTMSIAPGCQVGY